jgi:hypothetical protein
MPTNNKKKGEYGVPRDKVDHVNVAMTPIIIIKFIVEKSFTNVFLLQLFCKHSNNFDYYYNR